MDGQDPDAWLRNPRTWQGDQSLWPAYLRDDALSQVCSECGLSTWTEFYGFCHRLLSSGKSCTGIFGPEVFQYGQPVAVPAHPDVE